MLIVEVDVIRAEVSQRTVYAESHIFRCPVRRTDDVT
jgi:hypothetical protein